MEVVFRASEVAAVIGEHAFQNISKPLMRLWRDMDAINFCVAVSTARETNPMAGCVSNADVVRRVASCPAAKRLKTSAAAVESAHASDQRCAAGREAEAGAIAWYVKQSGLDVTERNTQMLTYVSPCGKWGIRGRTDGYLVAPETLLEVKLRTSEAIYMRPALPKYDVLQVNTYMAMRGVNDAVVVEVLAGADRPKVTSVKFDPDLWSTTLERLDRAAALLRHMKLSWTPGQGAAWLALAENDRGALARKVVVDAEAPAAPIVEACGGGSEAVPEVGCCLVDDAGAMRFVLVGSMNCTRVRRLVEQCGGRVTTRRSTRTAYVVQRRPNPDRTPPEVDEAGLRRLIQQRMRTIHVPTDEEMRSFVEEHSTPMSAAEAAATSALPQHHPNGAANQAWLDSRKHKITGSIVGGILGLNKYASQDDVLENLLFPNWCGNVCTEYGNTHEDDAQDATLCYLRARDPDNADIENVGFVPCTRDGMGWCGQSPDGIQPGCNRLVEYKGPYGQRNTTSVPDGPIDLYPRGVMSHAPTLGGHAIPVPEYYYAQVQWGAGLSGYDRVLFVVWAPAGTVATLPFAGEASGAAVAGQGESGTRVLHEKRVDTGNGNHVLESLVSTPKGLIQVTDFPRDDAWFDWALPRVRKFWEERYVPGVLSLKKA
jgi:hypothetical protein